MLTGWVIDPDGRWFYFASAGDGTELAAAGLTGALIRQDRFLNRVSNETKYSRTDHTKIRQNANGKRRSKEN
jgi:hypothetical protein